MQPKPVTTRKKASDFPQEVLDLFHVYVHGDIDRRAFLDGAGKMVGAAAAAVMLTELTPNYAWAQQVPANDPRIKVESATVPSPNGNGSIKGVLARPANQNGKLPGILVVHENRGLNPYIEDVARRLATANFVAFAPDGLTSVGGYPGDETKGAAAFRTVDGTKMAADFVAAAEWLKARADVNNKIGVVGFCYGGGVANNLAVTMGANLAAAAPYYGAQPSAENAAKIKAPIMAHYGSLDTGITGRWPAYDEALKAAGVTHVGYVYEGANHGFHNDTTPRYDEAAAKLSWTRTLEHFNKYVRG